MYLQRHQIYRDRFSNDIRYVMTLEDAHTDEQRVKVLDLINFEEKYINPFDIWDDPVDVDELDQQDLQCILNPDINDNPISEKARYGSFLYHVQMITDDSTLKDINDVHFEMDQHLISWLDFEFNLSLTESGKIPSYEYLQLIRAQHKRAIATIYSKKGAIII